MKVIPILFSLVLLIPIGMAQADYGFDGKWFCGTNEKMERADYEQHIAGVNAKLFAFNNLEPMANLEEQGNAIIGPYLENIGEKAKCLKENFGVEPDNVAKFSPKVLDAFENNMDKVIETAPTLVNYATVPEFGSIAMLILVTSILSIVIASRKIRI